LVLAYDTAVEYSATSLPRCVLDLAFKSQRIDIDI